MDQDKVARMYSDLRRESMVRYLFATFFYLLVVVFMWTSFLSLRHLLTLIFRGCLDFAHSSLWFLPVLSGAGQRVHLSFLHFISQNPLYKFIFKITNV